VPLQKDPVSLHDSSDLCKGYPERLPEGFPPILKSPRRCGQAQLVILSPFEGEAKGFIYPSESGFHPGVNGNRSFQENQRNLGCG
jgi:hypothetical protein